jgi:hypothetical protein
MALSLKHKFTNPKSDGGDSTIVRPSNWNDEHDLTAAANKIIGTTGTPGQVGEIDCTAAGRALLDDADAAAQRATLDLEIGVDVQAWGADLDAIDALSGTSGWLKKTALNTWALDTQVVSLAAGTAMLFQQTSAPTGWTKSTTHNEKALRIVSGSAGSGGSTAFTSVFTSRTPAGTVGSTTLSASQIPSHTHTFEVTKASNTPTTGANDRAVNAANVGAGASTGTTSTAGSGGSHNHSFTGTSMDFAVAYVDAIIATKD